MENWRVVAVTAEKKVAMVDKFSKFVAPCFWANRIVGTPVIVWSLLSRVFNVRGVES